MDLHQKELPQAAAAASSAGGRPAGDAAAASSRDEAIFSLVADLQNAQTRGAALQELSRQRDLYPNMAPILFHSAGVMAGLLQEIVKIYPNLTPQNLTSTQSSRVCNVLALLQCIASHPETRQVFIEAHMPLFLYPFLNTNSKLKPFEFLRLTSLGVMGALVKVDDPEVVTFLLQTEIFPLCLRIMEHGSELSKTVATFIVQKILLDEGGLKYVGAAPERYSAVFRTLEKVVDGIGDPPSTRLLKQIIRCYARLADHPASHAWLKTKLPISLIDGSIASKLTDEHTKGWLAQLLQALAVGTATAPPPQDGRRPMTDGAATGPAVFQNAPTAAGRPGGTHSAEEPPEGPRPTAKTTDLPAEEGGAPPCEGGLGGGA